MLDRRIMDAHVYRAQAEQRARNMPISNATYGHHVPLWQWALCGLLAGLGAFLWLVL